MNFVYWLVAMVLLAACVWLWIRYRREKGKRWDEISRAVGIEKELEAYKAREKCTSEAVLWYANQLTKEKKLGVEREEEIFRLQVWHNIMQDRLSKILCPTNNHVWKNGECVKCGVRK